MKKYIRIYYVEHTWRAELGWNDDSTRPPQSVHPSSSTTRLGTGNVTRVGTENELWIYWSFILYLYSRFSSLSLSFCYHKSTQLVHHPADFSFLFWFQSSLSAGRAEGKGRPACEKCDAVYSYYETSYYYCKKYIDFFSFRGFIPQLNWEPDGRDEKSIQSGNGTLMTRFYFESISC